MDENSCCSISSVAFGVFSILDLATLIVVCVFMHAYYVTSVMYDSLQPVDCGVKGGPLSRGFSRQEYWNGLPCSPPGDLSNPGI